MEIEKDYVNHYYHGKEETLTIYEPGDSDNSSKVDSDIENFGQYISEMNGCDDIVELNDYKQDEISDLDTFTRTVKQGK